MSFYCGLDLGCLSDPSALVVVDGYGAWNARTYDVRHIEQFPLQTPYPEIVNAVTSLLGRAPLTDGCTLVIDHTGVGRPVGDMFTAARRDYLGVTITGGSTWHVTPESRSQWNVAKILLVGTVQRVLQSERLRIGKGLPHAQLLRQELQNFRVTISKAANEIYEAREGAHDDMVLALAIALFAAENQGPPAMDVDPQAMEEIWRQSASVEKDGYNFRPSPRRSWRAGRAYW